VKFEEKKRARDGLSKVTHPGKCKVTLLNEQKALLAAIGPKDKPHLDIGLRCYEQPGVQWKMSNRRDQKKKKKRQKGMCGKKGIVGDLHGNR